MNVTRTFVIYSHSSDSKDNTNIIDTITWNSLRDIIFARP